MILSFMLGLTIGWTCGLWFGIRWMREARREAFQDARDEILSWNAGKKGGD